MNSRPFSIQPAARAFRISNLAVAPPRVAGSRQKRRVEATGRYPQNSIESESRHLDSYEGTGRTASEPSRRRRREETLTRWKPIESECRDLDFYGLGRRDGTRRPANASAFSLIEILVAVALMTVIMLGLLAMFYQAQRALRLGRSQVDILETGRATIEMIALELRQAVASRQPDGINMDALTAYQPLVQARLVNDTPHTNILQDLFFLRRENDEWIGTGYFVDALTDGGAGTLHRFEATTNVSITTLVTNLYDWFVNASRNNAPRLADRIIHFRARPYDRDGNLIWIQDFTFTNNVLPAYIDLELGVVEPKTYERYRSMADNPPAAIRYLTNHVDRVHLFRRRIPIRSAP